MNESLLSVKKLKGPRRAEKEGASSRSPFSDFSYYSLKKLKQCWHNMFYLTNYFEFQLNNVDLSINTSTKEIPQGRVNC